MAYKDIEKRREAIRRHYYANKSLYIEKSRRRKEELRALVRALKNNAVCVDCRKRYPYYVMDFDHLEGKEGLVSFFAKNGSEKRLRAEIEKCEIVCANCHRYRSFIRQNNLPT